MRVEIERVANGYCVTVEGKEGRPDGTWVFTTMDEAIAFLKKEIE